MRKGRFNMDILKRMQEDLESKEELLKEKQEYFELMQKNDSKMRSFERNAISDLLTTNELKTEIKILQHYIMLMSI